MKALRHTLTFVLVISAHTFAAEPWADERLGIRDGLVAWFDCSAQHAARALRKEPQLADGDQLAVWYDSSGHGRHLRNTDPASQPVVRQAGSQAFARFDGQADSLSANGLNVSCNELTVFVVAGTLSNDGGFRAMLASSAVIVLVAAADVLAGLFTADPAVRQYATDGLRVVGLGFPFYAYGMVVTQSFNGAGDTWTPTYLNLAVFWAFEIPIAWALSTRRGLGPEGVFVAITLAFSMLAVASTALFKRGRWKRKQV